LLRQEKRRAKEVGEIPRTLLEADFLLAVNDTARHGALTFPSAPPERGGVPPVHFLGRLLAASTRLQKDAESDEDIQLLLEPGASLGGARPKAAVQDAQGKLLIAKFPGVQDHWDVPLWEYIALKIAQESGLRVPQFQLEKIGEKNVLLTERFDRSGTERIPCASAMTLLDLRDGDHGSYLEMAEIARADGAKPAMDSKELWMRMVFNAMISNADDHLRNHAFLRDTSGWRLSPLFDLEASPPAYKAQYQHTSLFPGGSGLHLDEVFGEALAVSEEFGVSLDDARIEMQHMLHVGKGWPSLARAAKAGKTDMEIMESAFRLKLSADVVKIYSAHTHPEKNVDDDDSSPGP
jgi:serine/threonine-protein kinase HipA